MSVHRENVIWQSADGTWSRGFFGCTPRDYSDDRDEPDPEWDVDYDFGVFDWVWTGHPSEDAAARSWDGANPGGYQLSGYDADAPDGALRYDVMAAELELAERGRPGGTLRYWSNYQGPSKAARPDVRRAMLSKAGAAIAEFTAEGERYRLTGYFNTAATKLAAAQERYDRLRQEMVADGCLTEVEAREFDVARLTDQRDRLTALIEKTQDQRVHGRHLHHPRAEPLEPTIELRDQVAASLERAKPTTGGNVGKATGGKQGRQPAGVPTGGQFAANHQARPSVRL